MTEQVSATRSTLDVDLKMERIEADSCVQQVGISAETDGPMRVTSSGKPSRLSFRQIGQARQALQRIVEATGQDVIIEHEGRLLVHLHARPSKPAKWSIRWWSILQHWFQSR